MKTLKRMYLILSGKDPVCFWMDVPRHKSRKQSMKWLKRIRRIRILDVPYGNTIRDIGLWRAYHNATDDSAWPYILRKLKETQ